MSARGRARIYHGRDSFSGGDQFSSIVNDCSECSMLLENVARITKNNLSEIFETDRVSLWKQKIIEASVTNATVQRQAELSKEIVDDLGKRDASELSGTPTEAVKKVKTMVASKLDTFKPHLEESVQRVKSSCQAEEKDDDIVQVNEAGDQASDFICPYTRKKFDTPMKNPNCSHYMSMEGLDAMLRRKQSAPCPVPGCRATWQKGKSYEDMGMKRRMERFDRLQAANTASGQSQTNADITSLDDN
mmetsp:Transcript_14383/g.21556  ORF Transcript_14383/g.21556 Transcript_14383/m.21556 type:complete len:246 (+) Transcript_14383:57-794(+)